MSKRIKVMVIDDSLSIRLLLKGIVSEAPDMEIVAAAEDPIQAMLELKHLQPDVITLDVEMPEMDGITFLGKLMTLRPTPVVMISTLTKKGSATAIKALELGAVDVIGKPSHNAEELKAYTTEILAKIRAAAYARVGTAKPKVMPSEKALNTLDTSPALTTDSVLKKSTVKPTGKQSLIALGSSTGGPEALRYILGNIPGNLPGIVIAQHIAAGFTHTLTKRLDQCSEATVVCAEDGMPIKPGHVYVAPDSAHLVVKDRGTNDYVCKIIHGDRVNRHIPSVDVLFRSVADNVGDTAVAAILTGMGNDGACGMKEIQENGGHTIAQDEASCIVYGMPKVAVNMGGVNEILNIKKIPNKIEERIKK